MNLDQMIAYAEEISATIDNPLDRVGVCQIMNWLQELKTMRIECYPDKDFSSHDDEVRAELIKKFL